MGICITYKGRLDNPADLDALLDDVRQVSQAFNWPCTDISTHVSGIQCRSGSRHGKPLPPRLLEEDTRGVYVQPPDTETLRLIFNTRGRLAEYTQLDPSMINGPICDNTAYFYEFPLWVKTTGALDSHILLLVLLDRIKRKFMKNLAIRDDTGFYKTHDLDRLVEEHAAMSFFVRSLNDPGVARKLMEAAGVDLRADAEITPLPTQFSRPARPKPAAAKIQ